MDVAFQKRKFTELRFEYYVSGRILWFNDTLSIAGMLLGYAVELSLKQVLIASGESNQKLLRSHKTLDLFRACVQRKLLPTVEASSDFLQYVSDMFNQRYPSQVLGTAGAAAERGHALSARLDVITAYDDLVIQLDEALRSQYADDEVSVGLLAAHFVNRIQGRAFFHCNVAALRNTDFYRDVLTKEYEGAESRMEAQGLTAETIAYNLGNHKRRLETWAQAPRTLWHYDKVSTAIGPDFDTLRSERFAKDFIYPGVVM